MRHLPPSPPAGVTTRSTAATRGDTRALWPTRTRRIVAAVTLRRLVLPLLLVLPASSGLACRRPADPPTATPEPAKAAEPTPPATPEPTPATPPSRNGRETPTTTSTTTTTTAPLDPADEPASPSFGRTQFDRIIWSVHADEPRRLDAVRVGLTPRGFATVIPLDVPLPERLLIVARSDGDSSSDGVAELSVILGNVPADGTFVLEGVPPGVVSVAARSWPGEGTRITSPRARCSDFSA